VSGEPEAVAGRAEPVHTTHTGRTGPRGLGWLSLGLLGLLWFGVVGYPSRARRRVERAALAEVAAGRASLPAPRPRPNRTPLRASVLGASALLLVETLAAGAAATEAMLAGPLANGRRAARDAVVSAQSAATEVATETHLDSFSPPQLPSLPALPAGVSAPPRLAELITVAAAAPAPAPAQAPAMGHLPQWVQTKQTADLLSGPDTGAIRFTSLPAWTFLKVAGVQADRLKVQYAGDGGARRAGPGWVALDDVQPSDASGDWLRNHRASRLFSAATDQANSVGLPQWSPMLTLEPSSGERVHVRAYSSDFKQVIGEGWVPAADVGPTGAPDRAVNAQQALQAPASPFGDDHDAFIAEVGKAARASQAATGVPASVTVAQAILESDWGGSLLTRTANNYFGIKAMGQVGNDGAIWMRTMEYGANGAAYYTLAAFRAYKTLADGVTDHSQLFVGVPLYRSAMQATGNPDEFARRIAAAGYSTDPAYPAKLIGLMTSYNLYRFDQPA
jgi:mannosyl-glycoprotein endo-beta-N-acetylglucosaminidase